MQTRIERRNGTLLVPIPSAIAANAGMSADDLVELTSAEGRILVSQIGTASGSLADLLADVTDENLHDEIDTGPAVGAESW